LASVRSIDRFQIGISDVTIACDKVLSLHTVFVLLFSPAGAEADVQTRKRICRMCDGWQSQHIASDILIVIPMNVVRVGTGRCGVAEGNACYRTNCEPLRLQLACNGQHFTTGCIDVDRIVVGLNAAG
jgi:hypothetical protein